MKRSGMLRPTCCEIVPRDRTAFETYTTNLHYTPQLYKLFVVGWARLVTQIMFFTVESITDNVHRTLVTVLNFINRVRVKFFVKIHETPKTSPPIIAQRIIAVTVVSGI